MIENKAVKELEETLMDVINAHIDNEGISVAELSGVLIALIFRYNMKDDED